MSSQLSKSRSIRPLLVEELEKRTLLSALSDAAYQLLNARVTANQTSFYVYQNADSGLNHGFPSGEFVHNGDYSLITVNPAAIDDPTNTITGTTTDPNALDQTHGTVLQVTFGPLSGTNFAGLNIEEPNDYGTLQTGMGYDLTGATEVVFDVRTPTPGGIYADFGVGGPTHTTPLIYLPQSATFTTMTITLSSLGLTADDLTDIHTLFTVGTNAAGAGGTVLLDNIQFTPVPTSQQGALGLPQDTQTFGVVPLASPASGPIPFPDDQELTNVATTYEAALTEMALLHQGTPAALAGATLIDNTFVYALAHDNQGDALPLAPDGSAGLHNAYMDGDIALYNSQQPPDEGQAGQVRLAGFSVGTAFVPSGFALVLDGATGGNNAFAILALTAGYEQFQNPAYLAAAEEIGHWIVGNLADTSGTGYGGYYSGYLDEGITPKVLQTNKSVENNADIFAAFTDLAAIEGALGDTAQADYWTSQANVAGDFVMAMFDATDGRFYAGTVPVGTPASPGVDPSGPQKGNDVIDTSDFLDADTFTTLAMAAAPRFENQIDWRRPIQYALANFAQTVTADATTYQGFDIVEQPVSGSNGIAWEFTGQVVAAMQYVDNLYGTSLFSNSASFYLGQIEQAQATAPFGDGEGLVASTLQNGDALPPIDQCLNTPFQTIPERVGLAATTWAIFADQGINVFAPPPRVTVTSTASTSTYGELLSFSVSVTPSVSGSPTPTGTVQFQVDGSNFGSAVTLLDGTATSISTTSLPAGVHTITAVYPGDWDDAANSGSFSQTVDPAPLTITANDASKTYGAADPTLTYTVTGLLNGDPPSVISGVTLSTTTGAAATAGTHAIVATGGTAANYAITDVNGQLTVNRVTLSVTGVTAVPRVYNATTSDTLSTTSAHLSGIVNGDNVKLVTSGYVASFNNPNAGNNKPVTVTGMSLSGPAAANYILAQPFTLKSSIARAKTQVSVTVAPVKNRRGRITSVSATTIVKVTAPGSGVPTGTVKYYVNGKLVATKTLVKAENISTFPPQDAKKTIVVTYSGDPNFTAASSTRTVAKPAPLRALARPSTGFSLRGPGHASMNDRAPDPSRSPMPPRR